MGCGPEKNQIKCGPDPVKGDESRMFGVGGGMSSVECHCSCICVVVAIYFSVFHNKTSLYFS